MLTLTDASPVKPLAGVLWSDPEVWARALDAMQAAWGPSDAVGEPTPFSCTDYYRDEMGAGLKRQLVSFANLAPPEQLPALKLTANGIEADLLRDGRRTVNIDVGYLDHHKVVLASTKQGPHKIYMGRGVWADMTLRYERGRFHSFPWTFPDLRNGAYDAFLLHVRDLYKKALRAEL